MEEELLWADLYPFLYGLGLIFLIPFVYWFGFRSGRRKERIETTRKRWKQKQILIGHHQEERGLYVEKIKFLENELGRISQESESYQKKLDDIAFFRQKIVICEQQIKQLSSAEAEYPGLTLLYQMKNDPIHTNLTREDWDTLFALTDDLFGHCISSLQEKYGLTRHEQEICCLIKWYFPRKEQLEIFNNTSDALTKSKNRLKKRLPLDDKGDLETFIRQF